MTNPFSRTTLIVVIAVVALSLAVAAGLTIFSDELEGEDPSAGADSYSVSAIGHRGLVDLLAALDIPVLKSRGSSAEKARGGVLLVSEPTVGDTDAAVRLNAFVDEADTTLVVLPKWYGHADRGATWIDEAELLPVEEVETVLEALGVPAGVLRVEGTATIAHDLGAAASPRLRGPQLLAPSDDERVAVIAGTERGALLVQVEREDGGVVWVLSDPDVLNNHGLREAANAAFTVALVDQLRDGGPVVIDEVIHGYALPPSLLRTLFEFPLVLATLQVLICAVFAVWAAMVRFGPRKVPPPPFAPGKDFLIRNTAALLHYGGHHAEALRRYLQQSVAAVRHALHAPALDAAAMTEWLEKVRMLRGGTNSSTISLLDLERDTHTAETPQRMLEVAERIYRWRMEMIDEPRERT